MTTFFLTCLVALINILIYASNSPEYYGIASHLYYGIIILAGRYDSDGGQRILLAITAIANCLYVVFYFDQTQAVVATVIAVLYPFIAYAIVHTIRLFNAQRLTTERQIGRINQVNIELEQSVRDLSTLFEVSQTANADVELDELFQRIIKILADRLGTYRASLRLWKDGEPVKYVEAILGLTPAEIKRGTDNQLDDIEKKVLESGVAIGVPHSRTPIEQINLFDARSIQSKDPIAFWCMPLIVDEKVIGTLTIDKASDEFSAEDDRRILTIITSIIAQRVKIQQMIDTLVESERLATLGTLAATVAHEVRNPLGGIRGAAQLLQMIETSHSNGFDETSREEILEYTQVIIKEADRMNRVIEQLLTFGKQRTVDFEPHQISELINNSLSICEHDLNQNNIRVNRTDDLNCPLVTVNVDGITQVFLNVFRNAIESMDSGGDLTIQTQYDNKNREVQVCVQDTGCGITPDQIPKLFDPFYTTKPKGTGLGLAISHEILEEHGGRIKVDVTQSQGTTFIITLPCKTFHASRY